MAQHVYSIPCTARPHRAHVCCSSAANIPLTYILRFCPLGSLTSNPFGVVLPLPWLRLSFVHAPDTTRVTGETWPELWDKYERKIRSEDSSLEGEDLKTAICLRILEKSCSTSEMFNNLSGCSDLNSFLPDTLTETAPTQHQEAFAAESAAACAGALRLIPLMQPFRRAKMQGEGAVVVQKRAKRHTRRRKIIAGRRMRIRSSNRPRTL